jgi:hypothetical protein
VLAYVTLYSRLEGSLYCVALCWLYVGYITFMLAFMLQYVGYNTLLTQYVHSRGTPPILTTTQGNLY